MILCRVLKQEQHGQEVYIPQVYNIFKFKWQGIHVFQKGILKSNDNTLTVSNKERAKMWLIKYADQIQQNEVILL